MAIVPKKNGTLRICLDPQDFNHAIRRDHNPLPTIEEVASRLHGAKVFTILDVSKGFCHIQLDEPSSFLITFHTPLDGTAGGKCLVVSAQHQKYFSDVCTS